MHFYEVVDDEHVNHMHIQRVVNDVPILLKFEVLTFWYFTTNKYSSGANKFVFFNKQQTNKKTNSSTTAMKQSTAKLWSGWWTIWLKWFSNRMILCENLYNFLFGVQIMEGEALAEIDGIGMIVDH